MKRSTLALASVAVLATVAVSSALAGARISTEVKITSIQKPAGSPMEFRGTALSSKAKCRRDRKVVVFQNVAGPSIRIGSDRSGNGGQWSVSVDLNPANGDVYYARAPRKHLGDGKTCKSARSPDRTFTF